MSDKQITINEDQLASVFAKAVEAAVKAARAPNAKEQREIDEEISAQKRKLIMIKELGKAEQEAMDRKKHGCSHSRFSMASGKLGGHACAKGQGEWTTGGQALDRKKAILICTRCSYTWTFEPDENEWAFIQDTGLMGFPPPTKEKYGDRLLMEEGRPV
jgi:hypothetical protein